LLICSKKHREPLFNYQYFIIPFINRKYKYDMQKKYTDADVPDYVSRLYHKKKNGWQITGYKCPYCGKHYHSIRVELFTHVESCDGPKTKRSLED
jgi:hypothetical protein